MFLRTGSYACISTPTIVSEILSFNNSEDIAQMILTGLLSAFKNFINRVKNYRRHKKGLSDDRPFFDPTISTILLERITKINTYQSRRANIHQRNPWRCIRSRILITNIWIRIYISRMINGLIIESTTGC
ncbi:MAG: hypothetical protein ACI934_000184 [Pseudohongiellaceae bacterium]|jgi:hypothetical protein